MPEDSMSEDLADWIAEDMWRTASGIHHQNPDGARTAWLSLPDREKDQWRTLAEALIQDIVPGSRADAGEGVPMSDKPIRGPS
jgi:hypothetical protein